MAGKKNVKKRDSAKREEKLPLQELSEILKEARENKDEGLQFSTLRKMAAQGDPQATFDLAMAYRHGEGVCSNIFKSLKYLKDAASLGVVEAYNEIGTHYLIVDGETGYMGRAISYFKKGAAAKDPNAMFSLGVLILDDKIDNPKEIQKAISYIEQAASTGLPLAHRYLGKLYSDEYDNPFVPNDYKKAIEHLGQALELSDETADDYRPRVPTGMLDFITALAHKEVDCEIDSQELIKDIGKILRRESDEDVVASGMRILQKHSEKGDSDALYELALMRLAQTDDDSWEQGMEMMREAARQGHGESLYQTTLFDYEATGQDEPDKLLLLAEDCSQKGSSSAMRDFGKLCIKNSMEQINPNGDITLDEASPIITMALGHLYAASEMGDVQSLVDLALITLAMSNDQKFREGHINIREGALMLLDRAAKQGHEKARSLWEKFKRKKPDAPIDLNDLL